MAGDPNDPKWMVPAETARAIAHAIRAAGPRFLRIDIRVDESQERKPMTFAVIESGDEGERKTAQMFNDTFLCPPWCGGD